MSARSDNRAGAVSPPPSGGGREGVFRLLETSNTLPQPLPQGRGVLAVVLSMVLAGCSAAMAQDAGQVTDAAPAIPPQGTEAPPPGPPPMPQPLTLAQRPGATGGEALYVQHCAMCHGPNGMGTGLLGRTRPVALLEAREGLTPQFVELAVRGGIGNMPAVPRGEVTDAELAAIGAYLAAGPHEVAP